MTSINLEARVLGCALGLGDIGELRPCCHGYACGCVCVVCVERREAVSPAFLRWLERSDDSEPIPPLSERKRRTVQPWELVRRAA